MAKQKLPEHSDLSRVPRHIKALWHSYVKRYLQNVREKWEFVGEKPNRNGRLVYMFEHPSGRDSAQSERALLGALRKEQAAEQRAKETETEYEFGHHVRKNALDAVASMTGLESSEIDAEVFDYTMEKFVQRMDTLTQAYQKDNITEPKPIPLGEDLSLGSIETKKGKSKVSSDA